MFSTTSGAQRRATRSVYRVRGYVHVSTSLLLAAASLMARSYAHCCVVCLMVVLCGGSFACGWMDVAGVCSVCWSRHRRRRRRCVRCSLYNNTSARGRSVGG